jgi:hypothetical protein
MSGAYSTSTISGRPSSSGVSHVEHEDADAVLAALPGRPQTGEAASDDDGVTG